MTLVTCGRCLTDWDEADVGTLVRLDGGDPDNDDYVCVYEGACDHRMDRLVERINAI